jgi:hypothetical protein
MAFQIPHKNPKVKLAVLVIQLIERGSDQVLVTDAIAIVSNR